MKQSPLVPLKERSPYHNGRDTLEEEVLITIMALLIVLASFLSIVLGKVRLPSLVGFIIAGIIIHNYVDVPEGTEDVVSIFSNLGLIMLMFTIGMEIDINKLKIQGKFAMAIAIIQIPVMIFAGLIAGSAMGFSSAQALTFGAILAGASTAVVLAVLKANNVLSQEKMDILVLVMIIEDITQVILISILTPMMQGGEQGMNTDALILLILSIAVFMVVSFALGLKVIPRAIDWVYKRSSDETISLLCIGLVFVFALLANMVGLSVAIGAFLAGVMVGMSRPKHAVEHFVDPLKTLFMAMFFISVGMEVSVPNLVQNIPTILGFYLIFATCMFIAVNIGYWVGNGDARSGWVSAMSMCTMGEFAFIISALALKYKVFDESFYSSVIGAAILSMIILPLLVRSSDKTYAAANKVCPKPIKRFVAFMTKERDLLYHGLAVVSYRSKERFNKGLTNSAFLITLIVIIEIVFYFIYTPLSFWLANNVGGLTEYQWRLIILFANIVILLDPCRRLAKFLRLIVYITERGRNHINEITHRAEDTPKLYEYISTLHIGAAMTVVIVILVPNGIENFWHVVILLLVLAMAMLSQFYKLKKAVRTDKTEGTKTETAADGPERTDSEETTDSAGGSS